MVVFVASTIKPFSKNNETKSNEPKQNFNSFFCIITPFSCYKIVTTIQV